MIGYIFIAVFNGLIVGTSRAINSRLSLDVGVFKASFWNHLVGFVFLASVLILNGGFGFDLIDNDIPIFTYLGGFFGALFVAVNSYVFSRIGAIKTVLLVISGQMICSVLIDYKRGDLLSTLGQFLGVAIILVGVYLAKSTNPSLGKKIGKK